MIWWLHTCKFTIPSMYDLWIYYYNQHYEVQKKKLSKPNTHICLYILMNSMFTRSQYGFQPGRSCVTQLEKVLDEWSELFATVHNLAWFFPRHSIPCRISFIFDTWKIRIKGSILNWIKIFLYLNVRNVFVWIIQLHHSQI